MIIENALHLVTLDEDFDNPLTLLTPPPDPNTNIWSMAWVPSEFNAVPYPKGDIDFPIRVFDNDNYTLADYEYYATIPDVHIDRQIDPAIYQFEYQNLSVNLSAPTFVDMVNPKQVSAQPKASRSAAQFIGTRPILYGKITARIKFPQVLNNALGLDGTPQPMPNGVFPAFWLYEFPETVQRDCQNGKFFSGTATNPVQPQEIDIEVYTNGINDEDILLGFSIVDYGCGGNYKFNESDDHWFSGGYVLRRFGGAGGPSYVTIFKSVPRSFLDVYHIYTIHWDPEFVAIYVGDEISQEEFARFTNDDVLIPHKEMRIFFSQQWNNQVKYNNETRFLKNIPFPSEDIHMQVDYVRVE